MARFWLAIALLALGAMPSFAKDRFFDRDWRTGVGVAPGAMTWTNENFAEKKQLIGDIAASQGKTCTDNYAALGWPPGSANPDVIMAATRQAYEKAGYTVTQKPGSVDTDTIWIARSDAREAVILWGAISGSTIYVSCLTAGAPATDPDKPLYLALLSGLGLACLLGGGWAFWRQRALGQASLRWPSVTGVVKSSEIEEDKTNGAKQFMAKVAYDYAVAGTSYAGNTLRFGNYAGALASAQSDVAKYTAGAPVEVRYDPHKPRISVLEPGTAGVNVIGLGLAVTGALFLVVTALVATVA